MERIAVDWLNFLAIEILESTGNKIPTQNQIDLMESLLDIRKSPLTLIQIWQQIKSN